MPRDKSFNVVPVVKELRDIIVKGCKDNRLEYKNAKKTIVRIPVGKVIVASFKQTLIGRREKFRTEMRKQMAEIGWEEKGLYLYERVSDICRNKKPA